MECDKYSSKLLQYNIHKCSSYSNDKKPENILVDEPRNHESRWYTDHRDPNQYLILKLDKMAIVETILFGKYLKPHTTDLRKFNVYGGYEEDNMQLLLKGGLKNDNCYEVFNLRYYTTDGYLVPVQYIKIIPIQSWGNSTSFSIWHIALYGRNEETLMKHSLETIHLRNERETIRIILRYLRKRQYNAAYESLTRESGVLLDGPRQARFWNALVEEANFEEAERNFIEAANEGELEWYIAWQKYKPEWQLILACSPEIETKLIKLIGPTVPAPSAQPLELEPEIDHALRLPGEFPPVPEFQRPLPPLPEPIILGGDDDEKSEEIVMPLIDKCECRPGPRGGHQLVVDSLDNKLYLYAGWSGTRDLDDLWMFDVANSTWTLLCAHSGDVGGPSPTSCHKVVLDHVNKKLYTIGRYLDGSKRHSVNMKNDFYVYDLITNKWSLICYDVALVGGPSLLYDHQMCIDTETQTIYLFGGRLLPLDNNSEEGDRYSGLYSYHIPSNTWKVITDKPTTDGAPVPRIGHTMIFHSKQKRLYVFAGTAKKEPLMGLWWWDVTTGECGIVATSRTKSAMPTATFTQRASFDPDTNEMFILAGMAKDRRVFNTLWVFSFTRFTWSFIYSTEVHSFWDPRPRFAHQFVYDFVRKVHYLFGGNPGHHFCAQQRLDDLWSLKLIKPTTDDIVNRARVLLREARYKQLAMNSDTKIEALQYLRESVHATIDTTDLVQLDHYHQLTSALFVNPEQNAALPRPLSPGLAAELESRKIVTDDNIRLESPTPFEYAPAIDAEIQIPESRTLCDPAFKAREIRIDIYDELCQYFRPSVVPPDADINDLVDF